MNDFDVPLAAVLARTEQAVTAAFRILKAADKERAVKGDESSTALEAKPITLEEP